MQKTHNHENLPATLRAKIDKYVQQTKKTAANICQKCGLPAEYAEAIAADAEDMLHACYNGLHPTTEQMQHITAAVPRARWDRTENIPLCMLAGNYEQIAQILNGTLPPPLWNDFIASVVVLEVVKRDDGEQPLLICDEDALLKEVQRLYYTYAVLTAAEKCDATEDELRAIEPYGGVEVDEQKRQQLIRSGLEFARQRHEILQTQARKRGRPKKVQPAADMFEQRTQTALQHVGAPAAATRDASGTIRQFQNIAYMIGSGVKTADVVPYGETSKMRPLSQGVREQQERAAALMSDARATDEDRRKAAELITTTRAAMVVSDALQMIPQRKDIVPESASTEWVVYEFTPNKYTQVITGQDKPNSEQVLSLLRATAWLTTQRWQVTEVREKTITERDSSGVIIKDENGKPKRRKVQTKIVTNFQPVAVTFRTEYEDDVQIADATRIRLSINPMLRDGRSTNEITADGKIAAREKYIQLRQYYDFVTEEERIFRNLVLSRQHMDEYTLLSAVFGYEQRQAEANDDAAKAEAAAVELERNPTATDEQKQAARAAAEAAKKNARYCITNKLGRDVERLKAMFKKAYDDELLKWYYRKTSGASATRKQYGHGYVWEWGRHDDEDSKPATRRGRPKKTR